MIDFTIPEGKNTPNVSFNAKTNLLVISGKSYPENARKFYDEVLLNLKAHLFPTDFTIEMNFDYVSSSSVISLLEMLKKLKNISQATNFSVRFIYENGDDDMLGVGENYEKITGFKFEYISKN
jgi:SiaC family regulatory phosphoprotein